MGIFSNTVEKRIIDAVAARSKLVGRLQDTEIAITDARAIAQRTAIEGDDSQLDAAEAKTRVLVDRSQTLQGALAKVEAEIADLERQRDEALDRKTREQSASSLELLARELAESGEAFVVAVSRLHECMVRASCYVPEAAPLVRFGEMAKIEVPDGCTLIGRLVRERGASILRGEGRPTLAEPPQAFVEANPVKPPTTQVFCMRPVKFKNTAGAQIVVQKFRDAEMPPATARRALALKAAVEMTDPLRRQHHGSTPGHADPKLALDLDEAEREHTTEPVMHSAFEPPTIGPARVLKIAR